MFTIRNKRTRHRIVWDGEEVYFETEDQANEYIRYMVKFFKNEKMRAPWGKYAEVSDFEVTDGGIK